VVSPGNVVLRGRFRLLYVAVDVLPFASYEYAVLAPPLVDSW